MKWEFNINYDIKVKLTDEGFNHWLRKEQTFIESINKLGSQLKVPSKEDFKQKINEDGAYTFQLWEFMQIFGDALHMGGPQIIENNVIEFTGEDFQ